MRSVEHVLGLPRPHPRLRACAVIPAHDEEDLIAACLEAFVGQVEVAPEDFEVILVLDHCTDATEAHARAVSEMHPQLCLFLLHSPKRGAGATRRWGMDTACRRLLEVGRPSGLIASTDADSIVAPDWMKAQLDAIELGARALGGRIELSQEGLAQLPPAAVAWRERQHRSRHLRMLAGLEAEERVAIEHPQFSGASMGVTAEVYREVGGLDPKGALEDEAFERTLARHGIPIVRSLDIRVTTSARTNGRALRGLARDLGLASWVERRTYEAADYSPKDLLERKRDSVSVILPARNVASTLGDVLDAVLCLARLGLIDEIVVIDAASADASVDVARSRRVPVYQESEVLCEFGPALGKGDAMWRGLAATKGDIVVYVDTDTENFDASFVTGLLGPLFSDPEIQLVKGAFRRPFRSGRHVKPDEGGRVTELMARPFLNLYVPELAGFAQPLAGEIAARRCLLEAIPFPVGYGIEIGMLIDAVRLVGIDALAQVNLGVRQNRHQALRDLSGMAYAVLAAGAARTFGLEHLEAYAPGPLAVPSAEGMDLRRVPLEERPPLRGVLDEIAGQMEDSPPAS